MAWQLEADGYQVLLQAWDKTPGRNWVNLMHEGVERADRTVVVLSEQYLQSLYGTAEWEAAWQRDPLGEGRRLIVVRVDRCASPGLLASVVTVDLFGLTRDAARQRLRDIVAHAIAGRAKPVAEPVFPPELGIGPAEPRFPGALPPVWNAPLRNPHFTGRAVELERVQAGLTANPAMTVEALRGMGGVGKTQIAIEYVHRHAPDYDVVWWFNAERATLLSDQFTALADNLGLPPVTDPDDAVRAVGSLLRGRPRWLLVFDNAETVDDIRPLLPDGPGHVLVTTRRSGFSAVGGVLDLDVLSRPEAVALLRRRASTLGDHDAERLARRLGDLPLALDQAAAYLDQTGMTAGEYLRLLASRAADLHGRGQPASYPGTMATVWSVSIETLQRNQPAAVQLLGLCAWLAPEPIPLDLFSNHAGRLPDPLARAAADPLMLAETVGALVDYSLARRAQTGLLMHRLVQDITRQRWPAAPNPLTVVLALLRADLSNTINASPQDWPKWRQLLPHVLAATSRHDDTHIAGNEDTAWLLHPAGVYLRILGRPGDARPLIERAIHLHQATHGTDHPLVAADLNVLGKVLRDLGRPADAIAGLERALAIRQAALGPDHPDVADDLAVLGAALRDLGLAGEAQPLLERALRIHEAALGSEHPSVAADLNALGHAVRDLGRPEEGQRLLQRALRISVAAFGPNHAWVADDLNVLGRILQELGRVTEARALLERAVRIRQSMRGRVHPTVADDVAILGQVLCALGRPAEAQSLFERALTIHESAYGPDHPWTAVSLSGLGRAMRDLGRPAEGRPLLERALRIDEAAYGPDHPELIWHLIRLSRVLDDLGQPTDAGQLLDRAVRIAEGAFGPDHPQVDDVRQARDRLDRRPRRMDLDATNPRATPPGAAGNG